MQTQLDLARLIIAGRVREARTGLDRRSARRGAQTGRRQRTR